MNEQQTESSGIEIASDALAGELQADLRAWVGCTKAKTAVAKMTALPHFRAVVEEKRGELPHQVVEAIKAVLRRVLPAETDDHDLRALRELCRLGKVGDDGDDGTSTFRRTNANLKLKKPRSGWQSFRNRRTGSEGRLLDLLTELLMEEELRVRRIETSSSHRLPEAGVHGDQREPEAVHAIRANYPHTWLYLSRALKVGHPTSAGLIGLELEVDLALGRNLMDANAASAPEVVGSPSETTILDLVGSPRPESRLVLVEAEGGAGKSSVTQALEFHLLQAAGAVGNIQLLVPVRLELPLRDTAGNAVALQTAIEHRLGADAVSELANGSETAGLRIVLLLDGADQDVDWVRTSQWVRSIAEEDWIAQVFVTGRPGSLQALGRTSGRARFESTGQRETFAASRYLLDRLTVSEVVRLIRTYAGQRGIADVEHAALEVLSNLSYLDSILRHAFVDDGRRKSWFDPERPIDSALEYLDLLAANDPRFQRLGPSVTPLTVLLVAWVVFTGPRDGAIRREEELFAAAIDRWQEREAQRLHEKRLPFEPDGVVLAATLLRLVGALGELFVEADELELPEAAIERAIARFGLNAAKLETALLHVWISRLADSGLLTRTSTVPRQWRFIHGRFAAFMCAQHLLNDSQAPDHAIGRAPEAWDRFLLGAQTASRSDRLAYEPKLAMSYSDLPARSRQFMESPALEDLSGLEWLEVTKFCLALLCRSSLDRASRLVDVIASRLLARDPSALDGWALEITQRAALDLLAWASIPAPPEMRRLARRVLEPRTGAMAELQDLESQLAEARKEREATSGTAAASFGAGVTIKLLEAFIPDLLSEATCGPTIEQALTLDVVRAMLHALAQHGDDPALCDLALQARKKATAGWTVLVEAQRESFGWLGCSDEAVRLLEIDGVLAVVVPRIAGNAPALGSGHVPDNERLEAALSGVTRHCCLPPLGRWILRSPGRPHAFHQSRQPSGQ